MFLWFPGCLEHIVLVSGNRSFLLLTKMLLQKHNEWSNEWGQMNPVQCVTVIYNVALAVQMPYGGHLLHMELSSPTCWKNMADI